MAKDFTTICPVCNQPAPWVENKEMYGRNYGKSYMCYYCKGCDTYVGCHNNTRKPLGTMATCELREYRKKVHAKIDPLWNGDKHLRRNLYAYLSKVLGYQYHTGESDIETCKKILTMGIHKDKLE